VVIGVDTKAFSIQSSCHVMIPAGVLPKSVGDLNDCSWVSYWPFVVGNLNF
jgi:hypothetical protein